MARYFLENKLIKVEIDSFGAEVKSILRKDNYREYMWYGNKKYWGRTSPVLFPFVGSMKDKKYLAKGKEYPMGQHGFARDMEFKFLSEGESEIWFELSSNEETLAKYPYEFVLQIGYILNEDTVGVVWRVENPSNEDIYFSIGAHPAFLCPVHGENSKTGYGLYFDGVSEINHHGNTVDTGLAIMDNKVLALNNGVAKITDTFFDECTYMIEGNQTSLVGINDCDGNRIVDVMFETPLFAVWSPEKKNAPFICIEPWYGRCDRTDFEGSIEDRDYTNTLKPGQHFEGGYSMKFYKV